MCTNISALNNGIILSIVCLIIYGFVQSFILSLPLRGVLEFVWMRVICSMIAICTWNRMFECILISTQSGLKPILMPSTGDLFNFFCFYFGLQAIVLWIAWGTLWIPFPCVQWISFFRILKLGFFFSENAENVMCEQACENSMRTLNYLVRRCIIVREYV